MEKLKDGFYTVKSDKTSHKSYISVKGDQALWVWKIGNYAEMRVSDCKFIKKLYTEFNEITELEFVNFSKSVGNLFAGFYTQEL